MTDDNDRSGDLHDSGMGDGVSGGSVGFDQGPGDSDHHNVHGDGAHFSWDRDRSGNVSGSHGDIHRGGGSHDPW